MKGFSKLVHRLEDQHGQWFQRERLGEPVGDLVDRPWCGHFL